MVLFVGISAAANVFSAFQWLRDNDKKKRYYYSL